MDLQQRSWPGMSRSFALRIVGDRFYFFNISIINWKREQVQTYSLCQIGPWRASPLPHLSGFPLVIPSACGRNEIYHLKARFVRIQQKQGKHLAGVQFLLHLSEFPPVIPSACGLDEIYHLKCSPCYGTIGGKGTQGQNCNATDPIYSYLFDGETMRCYNRFNSGKQRMCA